MAKAGGYMAAKRNEKKSLYTKNNESIHQLLSNGEIAPEAMADDVFVNSSIAQYEQNVNMAKRGLSQ